MSELLGLLDTLESLVLDSQKVPFTDKVMIKEDEALQLIDKLRLCMSSQGNIARSTIDRGKPIDEEVRNSANPMGSRVETESEVILNAKVKGKKIRDGANDYADYVLANLELMITKLQKNLIRLEQNIESGREALDTSKQELVTQVEARQE